MTPMERANAVIASWGVTPGMGRHLAELIQNAIIEATNAEVERRQAAEAEVSRLQRIINKLSGQPDESPVPEKKIEFGENYVRLKIRHPHTGEWWEISATQEQPHLQGEVQRAG